MAPNHNRRGSRRETSNEQNRQRFVRRHATRRQNGPNRDTERQATRYVGCGICKADHRIMTCRKFLGMNLTGKYRIVVKHHYCANCLARNHLIGNCNNSARCLKCGEKHHTLLHGHQRILNNIRTGTTPIPAPRNNLTPIPAPRHLTSTVSTSLPLTRTQIFVPTAVVQIAKEKQTHSARVLLNPSLTTSRIAVSLVREADLAPFKVDGKVYAKVVIMPNVSVSSKIEVCMLVVNDLPKKPYSGDCGSHIKEKFCRISLADPEFYSNTPVAIEIGGDLYTTILKPNTIQIDGGNLVAQDSNLGWLVMGSVSN